MFYCIAWIYTYIEVAQNLHMKYLRLPFLFSFFFFFFFIHSPLFMCFKWSHVFSLSLFIVFHLCSRKLLYCMCRTGLFHCVLAIPSHFFIGRMSCIPVQAFRINVYLLSTVWQGWTTVKETRMRWIGPERKLMRRSLYEGAENVYVEGFFL